MTLKLIQGVIIEGLPTTGKTSLLSALKRLHAQSSNVERTLIAVSEHYLQMLISDNGVLRTLDQDEHLKLLLPHVTYLENLNNWIEPLGYAKRSHAVFFILERFHLNHRAAFADHAEIEKLEKRLLKLNARCVHLTLSPEVVNSRYVESRGEDWKSFVMKYHRVSTAKDTCREFLKDQETLRQCAAESFIPTLEINTDLAEWDLYAAKILEGLDTTSY